MHDGNIAIKDESKKVSSLRSMFKDTQILFVLGALVIVIILMYSLNPRFLSFDNIINVGRQMSINMVIAVGMTFCIISGGIDRSSWLVSWHVCHSHYSANLFQEWNKKVADLLCLSLNLHSWCL